MKYFVIGALFLLPFPTHATLLEGNDGAHGGQGVLVSGKIELLDLFERGITENETANVPDPSCGNAARAALPAAVEDATIQTLCRRISAIRARDSLTGLTLVRALAMHRWAFSKAELNLTKAAEPLVKVPEGSLTQIAIRTTSSIIMAEPAWRLMTDYQRSALLIHEAVYSLLPWKNGAAKGMRARELTAYLLQAVTAESWADWQDVIGSDLPLIERLIPRQINESRGVPLLNGAMGTELGVRDVSAYNQAFWIEQTFSGKKFIGFAPVVKARYLFTDHTKPGEKFMDITFPLTTEVEDPLAKFVNRFYYPTLTVNEHPEVFTDLICQAYRGQAPISDIDLYFYTYAIYLEKETETQTIAWKLVPEPEQYLTLTIEAATQAGCTAGLPSRFRIDDEMRRAMENR